MQSPLSTNAENLHGMETMPSATGLRARKAQPDCSALTFHIVFISCLQKYAFPSSNSPLAGVAEETEGWWVAKSPGI